MTVTVELDANPPRLRRADGLIVQFPPDLNGGCLTTEVGWLQPDGELDLLFSWRCFVYQELQPGDGVALLVGHAPRGGYSSAVIKLDDRGVELDFADRVPADPHGKQTIVIDAMVRDDLVFNSMTAKSTIVQQEASRTPPSKCRQIVLTRPAEAKPFTHRHRLIVPARDLD